MCANVFFRHSWKSLDITKIFLSNLVRPCVEEVGNDVWITSVFPTHPAIRYVHQLARPLLPSSLQTISDLRLQYRHYPPVKDRNVFNVWFSGENCRPPVGDGWDAFLSFDLDNLGGLNHYLPLWVTRLAPNVDEVMEVQNRYLEQRPPADPRKKFACAFVGNPEPTRMRFIHELGKIGHVDLFGKAVGNPVRDKSEIMKSYMFNVCFENDLYPGYVTEKPLEALESGCIPIWSGLDEYGSLNEDAIVNLAVSTLGDTLDAVADIRRDESRIAFMNSRSILKKTVDLHQIQRSLTERFQLQ